MSERKQRRIDSRQTFTKIAVRLLLAFGLVNATMPYVLSMTGRDPVTELGTAWLAEVIGVFGIYAFKAYFETKQEAKQELENRKQDLEEYQAGLEDAGDE